MLGLAAIAASFGAAAAIVYLQLRHVALAVLVLVTPALAIAALDAGYAREPFDESVIQILVYVFAAVCGQLLAQRLVRGICDGLPPRKAFRNGCKDLGWVIGPVAAAAILPALANMVYPQLLGLAVYYLLYLLCATAAVVAAVGAAAWLPYTEDFVARANLAREAWQRRMAPLDFLGQARWALSLSGVALVLATLAGFGMQGLHLGDDWPYFPIAGAFWIAALALVTRDWRMTVSLMLALALVVAFYLAAHAGGDDPFGTRDIAWLSLCCATGGVPMGVLAASWSRFLREGDDVATALARALLSEGPTVLFATMFSAGPAAVLLAFSLVFVPRGHTLPPYLVAATCFPLALFAVFPALAVALYTLRPRYRSVEEVFGKR